MIRAHKIRLNPTPEQAEWLAYCCHVNRAAYNWAVAEWTAQYKAGGKPSAMALKAKWNSEIDTVRPWVRESCRDAYTSAFFDVDDAFSRFFKKQNRYPKFKSKKTARMSFGLANDKFRVTGQEARLPKIGLVNMAEALRFSGKIVKGTVSLKAGRWYLSVTVEMPERERQRTGRQVGIDVGIKSLAVTSDGEVLENQKPLRKSLAKLKRLNRWLARKQKGSKNWQKSKLELQRFHEHLANQRKDTWHKFTSDIAERYDTVCIEDLNVKGMTKNRKLSRAIADAGWAIGFAMLDYKCHDVRRIPRFQASSKPCHVCGAVKTDLTLADRLWICECGNIVDRDLNAALNIRDIALGTVSIGLMQPLIAFAPALARSSVKRSRTVCKTASAATQDEVNTRSSGYREVLVWRTFAHIKGSSLLL